MSHIHSQGGRNLPATCLHLGAHRHTELEIYLTASDGAVLVDTVDPIEPFGILLWHATGVEEITEMFSYSPDDNTVSLRPSYVADFRDQMKGSRSVQLILNGGDSVGNGACIWVPIINSRYQIFGIASTTSGSLDGTLVTLEGMNGDFTAVTQIGSQGDFHFDNVPGDTYWIEIGKPGEVLGTGFCRLEGEKGNTFAASVHIIGPDTPIQCQPEASGEATSRP